MPRGDLLIHGVRACNSVKLKKILTRGILLSESEIRKGYIFCQLIEGWELLRPKDAYCWWQGVALVLSPDVLRDLPFTLDFFGKAHDIESGGRLILKNMKQTISDFIHLPKRKPSSFDFMSSHQFVFEHDVASKYIVGLIVTLSHRDKRRKQDILAVLKNFPNLFAIIHRPVIMPRILQDALKSIKKGEILELKS